MPDSPASVPTFVQPKPAAIPAPMPASGAVTASARVFSAMVGRGEGAAVIAGKHWTPATVITHAEFFAAYHALFPPAHK